MLIGKQKFLSNFPAIVRNAISLPRDLQHELLVFRRQESIGAALGAGVSANILASAQVLPQPWH